MPPTKFAKTGHVFPTSAYATARSPTPRMPESSLTATAVSITTFVKATLFILSVAIPMVSPPVPVLLSVTPATPAKTASVFDES